MDFIEEKTPEGLVIKIFLKKQQFLAFDRKGQSIYTDSEGRRLLHRVPLMITVGKSFKVIRDISKEFTLLKIRDGNILFSYRDLIDKKMKYVYLPTDTIIDLIPVKIHTVDTIEMMIRAFDASTEPDYILVDKTITDNDIVIIKGRYRVANLIRLEESNNYIIFERNRPPVDEDRIINLNMMSNNPVFLARFHLRSMDLSKINQLLLDFDISALEAEFISNFINVLLRHEDDDIIKKNKNMLLELEDSFKFYMYLLQRNDEDIRKVIDSRDSVKKLAPFSTLVSKVKSLYPGKEEQLQFTDYENIITDKIEELQKAKVRA